MDRLLGAWRIYRAARQAMLRVCGREDSNHDPLSKFAEALAAAHLGGQLAENPAQPGWDVALPTGENVQVKCLANSAEHNWTNGIRIAFPHDPTVTQFCLLVVIDLEPKHLLIFRRGELEALAHNPGLNYTDGFNFGAGSYRQIINAPNHFEAVEVVPIPA